MPRRASFFGDFRRYLQQTLLVSINIKTKENNILRGENKDGVNMR